MGQVPSGSPSSPGTSFCPRVWTRSPSSEVNSLEKLLVGSSEGGRWERSVPGRRPRKGYLLQVCESFKGRMAPTEPRLDSTLSPSHPPYLWWEPGDV